LHSLRIVYHMVVAQMARSRRSSVLIPAATLGMLVQFGLPRSLEFSAPRAGPPTTDSSTAAETYMAWDAKGSQDHRLAATQDNSLTQDYANVSGVCATVMLMFALLLGVMVPPSHAKTAETLLREALKNPRAAMQQQKPVKMLVQEQKQIETTRANLQKDTNETAKKEPEKPEAAEEQQTEKNAQRGTSEAAQSASRASVLEDAARQQREVEKPVTATQQQTEKSAQRDTSEAAQSASRASVLEDAARQQRGRAEKLLVEEKQKEKAAVNLQKFEKRKSAERLLREALENAKAEKIKQSAEPKEQQTEELKQLAEQQARENDEDEKEDALRLKILGDLEKRKADAEKAAAEAEAIAEKIEQLAKDARKAALAAKEMATLLR